MMPITRCRRLGSVRPCAKTMRNAADCPGPAPVALEKIQKGGRRLLERAAQVGRHPDLPAGAAQKRGLDKIMAHDLAAERRLARQARQAAMLHEGAHPDDGVMAPIIAVRPLQQGQTRV